MEFLNVGINFMYITKTKDQTNVDVVIPRSNGISKKRILWRERVI